MKELDTIERLQYKNLRKHFNKLIDDVLGENYYNEGMDVYTCDKLSCRDLKNRMRKKRTCKLFKRKK